MKKSYIKHIHVISIEKEDLEYIESTLKKLEPTDLRIKIPGYELENVNEFDSLKPRQLISTIEFVLHDPEYVSIEIESSKIRMYTTDGNNVAIKGVFWDIEQRLKRKFLYSVAWLAGAFIYLGSISFISSLAITMSNQLKGTDYHEDRAITLILASLAAIIAGCVVKLFMRFRINPYEKIPNFFKRHGDALILSAISLITGGIITYIVTMLAK